MIEIVIVFIVAVALAAAAGALFTNCGPGRLIIGLLVMILSCLFVTYGALALVFVEDGSIGSIYHLDTGTIYKVDGQVETHVGKVIVLSNGRQEVRAVWNRDSKLPENARYVRVDDKRNLVPMECPPPIAGARATATQPRQ